MLDIPHDGPRQKLEVWTKWESSMQHMISESVAQGWTIAYSLYCEITDWSSGKNESCQNMISSEPSSY